MGTEAGAAEVRSNLSTRSFGTPAIRGPDGRMHEVSYAAFEALRAGGVPVGFWPSPEPHRAEYASELARMPEGAARRAEILQLLLDVLDAVEQSSDEAAVIAALKAYQETP